MDELPPLTYGTPRSEYASETTPLATDESPFAGVTVVLICWFCSPLLPDVPVLS